jgi:hypothetical protein
MYFRSLTVITNDQLLENTWKVEGFVEQNGASLSANIDQTHTDPRFGYLSLELDIYDNNNPSEYSPSPFCFLVKLV